MRRCLVLLAALSAVSTAGRIGAPALWDRPLLLVVLSPRLPFLVHAGRTVPWYVLGPVALARLCGADPAHFLLGRHGGDVVRRRVRRWSQSERWARWPRLRPGGTFHRRLARAAPAGRGSTVALVALRPIGRHLAAAGASHARPGRVAVADVLGTVAYVAAVLVGGAALG